MTFKGSTSFVAAEDIVRSSKTSPRYISKVQFVSFYYIRLPFVSRDGVPIR